MADDKVIVSCALAGAAVGRQQCPYIPFTPEEFAGEARRARDAGAAVVQVHGRRVDGSPSAEIADVRPIVEAIRAAVPDVVVSVAGPSAAVSVDKRIALIEAVQPDTATVLVGSANYALFSRGGDALALDAVLVRTFEDMRAELEAMRTAGVRPDHECLDAGHVDNLDVLGALGEREEAPVVTLVLGVRGALAATDENLVHQVRRLPQAARWQVAGVRHPEQWRILAAALGLGGAVRVGLGDNFYLRDGQMATTNGELVAKAVELAEAVGRQLAAPAEARAALRVVARDRTAHAVDA